jgi:NAD(P)-dependent dehydrogenase (short-subunit alcohol dehydrogenase family)
MGGRVAVVTGGASGIGLGIGRRLAKEGRRVALLDVNGEGAEKAAAELSGAGHDAVGLACDVSARQSVSAAFGEVRSQLGPCEILVTSAGVESFTPLADITDEIWDRVIDVNLKGTFLCAQEAVADMLPASWGRIVTIASSSAHSGAPRMVHYTASKGGVISMTRSLAVELGRNGITANAISPTVVDTPMAQEATARGDFPGIDKIAPMIPAGRAGTPEDIAEGVAYFTSDDASYVTGQIMCISGGMYI